MRVDTNDRAHVLVREIGAVYWTVDARLDPEDLVFEVNGNHGVTKLVLPRKVAKQLRLALTEVGE